MRIIFPELSTYFQREKKKKVKSLKEKIKFSPKVESLIITINLN